MIYTFYTHKHIRGLCFFLPNITKYLLYKKRRNNFMKYFVTFFIHANIFDNLHQKHLVFS